MARYKSVHTGPQIDSGVARALSGGEIDQSMAAKLDWEGLINPEFTVAQAGIGGNHGSIPYAADCWKLVSGTVSAAPGGGLVLNGTIRQTLETAVGFDAVASINVTSGTATAAYDDATKQFDITSSGGTIKRAHLGLRAIEDWSKMPKVDRDFTLLKCRKYYKTVGIGCIGIWQGTDSAFFSCAFDVQMRTEPVLYLISSDVTLRTLGVGDVISTSAALAGLTRTTVSGIDYVAVGGFSGGIDKAVCVPGDNIFALVADV